MSTTALGPWYATTLRWRRRVALLVNQATLTPLLTPLAPARIPLERLPDAVAELLAAHRLPAPFIHAERAAMADVRLAPTANRSVVGVLNEFARLADSHRTDPARPHAIDGDGLLELSLLLARTPLGPLYPRHVSQIGNWPRSSPPPAALPPMHSQVHPCRRHQTPTDLGRRRNTAHRPYRRAHTGAPAAASPSCPRTWRKPHTAPAGAACCAGSKTGAPATRAGQRPWPV
jgi:hypothetical protein